MAIRSARTRVRQAKLFTTLHGYDRHTAAADITAGVTVGLVALPLAMAFAISSGLPPQAGLYTAVIAGGLISLLGGSRVQIGGPTGAFMVIVAGIVAQHGVEGLFLCTVMAGALLVVLGVTGMGSAVRFIPRPVVVGFTNGIAVLIASTQIRDFFGLRIDTVPSEFLPRLQALIDVVRRMRSVQRRRHLVRFMCRSIRLRSRAALAGSWSTASGLLSVLAFRTLTRSGARQRTAPTCNGSFAISNERFDDLERCASLALGAPAFEVRCELPVRTKDFLIARFELGRALGDDLAFHSAAHQSLLFRFDADHIVAITI